MLRLLNIALFVSLVNTGNLGQISLCVHSEFGCPCVALLFGGRRRRARRPGSRVTGLFDLHPHANVPSEGHRSQFSLEMRSLLA